MATALLPDNPGLDSSENQLQTAVYELLKKIKEIEPDWWLPGISTRVLSTSEGTVYFDKSYPGTCIVVRTGRSMSRTSDEAFTDIQSWESFEGDEILHNETMNLTEQPPPDCWAKLAIPNMAVPERIEALYEAAEADARRAASYLVAEMSRQDTPEEWRYALVFAAEDLTFPDVDLQRQIRDCLLDLAEKARVSQKPGAEQVTWSALRRAGSLLEIAEAGRLLPFLDRRGAVDTRSVTLQIVFHLFEDAPPPDGLDLSALKDRIAEYAKKFLDPDVFSGGENAAIAKGAVCALAAMADIRLTENIAQVLSLRRRWLTRQIRLSLDELLKTWKARNPQIGSQNAFQVVERQLRSLAD